MPDTSNWRLYIYEAGIHPRAAFRKPSQKSIIQLVDIRSITFAVVSSKLLPLESPEHIIATYDSHSLEVSLPRLHLSFYVNSDWELECRSMPGYVIDRSQSCGTMFGLRNKLILCPRPNRESLLPRRVIIPQGKLLFRTDGDFAGIYINTDSEQHVRWHEYTIDTDLGCLRSSGNLSSKLYQCYLHALTSHCLPDPLLGHTGTEEALYMLRSAACQSFQRLDGHDAKLLELISDLTPDRLYYPPHLQSMATVKWNDLPALSQHHDFFRVVCSILDHARALEALYHQPAVFDTAGRNEVLLNRAASRNNSCYPSDLQTSEQKSSLDVEYKSRDVPDRAAAKHVAYQTSWSIWNAQPSLDRRIPNLWDLMSSWDSLGPANSEVSLRYSRYWLQFDAARDWLAIYDLCRRAGNGNVRNSRIGLSFCLAAAAYSKSKYSDVVPFIIIFALDERFRYFDPPPDLSYTLSDGVAPILARLEKLVSRSALPLELTPTYLKVEESKTGKVKKRHKKEYNAAIKMESSVVANSILRQWPYSESVDFREQWFNKSECRRSVEEYFQSVSRNIQLRVHVQRLQSIMLRYRKDPIPLTPPYIYSPNFISSRPKAPSYSIRDLLSCRTDVPHLATDRQPFLTPRLKIPIAAEAEGGLPPISSNSPRSLIDELRHSRQPLLKLYGNELNKSYRELMEHNGSQSARDAVPSHELLCLYHYDCSHRKDKIFSEISAALAPSQNVEKANALAGLWPRVTPRFLLRQLAQDRIVTLSDWWKGVITRYAVCLIKYQQSQRLLELWSGQKHEELLREIESIRSDVLEESTSDWLLIQVRPSSCRRSNWA